MASLIFPPEPPASLDLRPRLEPVPVHHTLFDGSCWPSSADLNAELGILVPVLDHVRGPVARLELSAAGWTVRPHEIIAVGRTVSIDYLAGQSPLLMNVQCADGGSCTLRVTPPRPAPGSPDRLEIGGTPGIPTADA